MIPLGKEIICVILVFFSTTQMSYGEGIWDFLISVASIDGVVSTIFRH